MNNIFKTLLTFYTRAEATANTTDVVQKGNQAEFTAYFILFQIGNHGEVSRMMHRLSSDLLRKKEIIFAIDVYTAIERVDYVRFMHLFKQANVLQACLMHNYIDDIRFQALRRMVRTMVASSKWPIVYPIEELKELFLFEDYDECCSFLRHCGMTLRDIEVDGQSTGQQGAVFEAQNLTQCLPTDRHDNPIFPKTKMMERGINSKIYETAPSNGSNGQMMHIAHVCQGYATNSVILPQFVPVGSTAKRLHSAGGATGGTSVNELLRRKLASAKAAPSPSTGATNANSVPMGPTATSNGSSSIPSLSSSSSSVTTSDSTKTPGVTDKKLSANATPFNPALPTPQTPLDKTTPIRSGLNGATTQNPSATPVSVQPFTVGLSTTPGAAGPAAGGFGFPPAPAFPTSVPTSGATTNSASVSLPPPAQVSGPFSGTNGTTGGGSTDLSANLALLSKKKEGSTSLKDKPSLSDNKLSTGRGRESPKTTSATVTTFPAGSAPTVGNQFGFAANAAFPSLPTAPGMSGNVAFDDISSPTKGFKGSMDSKRLSFGTPAVSAARPLPESIDTIPKAPRSSSAIMSSLGPPSAIATNELRFNRALESAAVESAPIASAATPGSGGKMKNLGGSTPSGLSGNKLSVGATSMAGMTTLQARPRSTSKDLTLNATNFPAPPSLNRSASTTLQAVTDNYPESPKSAHEIARLKKLTALVKQSQRSRLIHRSFRMWNQLHRHYANGLQVWVIKKYFHAWQKEKKRVQAAKINFFQAMSTMQIIPPGQDESDDEGQDGSGGFTGSGRGRGGGRRGGRGRGDRSSYGGGNNGRSPFKQSSQTSSSTTPSSGGKKRNPLRVYACLPMDKPHEGVCMTVTSTQGDENIIGMIGDHEETGMNVSDAEDDSKIAGRTGNVLIDQCTNILLTKQTKLFRQTLNLPVSSYVTSTTALSNKSNILNRASTTGGLNVAKKLSYSAALTANVVGVRSQSAIVPLQASNFNVPTVFPGTLGNSTNTSMETWQGSLLMKVLLFAANNASEAGLFINQTDCPMTAMMRASMCNEEGYFYNFHTFHQSSRRTGYLLKDCKTLEERNLLLDEQAHWLRVYQTVGSNNLLDNQPVVKSPESFLLSKVNLPLPTTVAPVTPGGGRAALKLSTVDVPGLWTGDHLFESNSSSSSERQQLQAGAQGMVLFLSNFQEHEQMQIDLFKLSKLLSSSTTSIKSLVLVISLYGEEEIVKDDDAIVECDGLLTSRNISTSPSCSSILSQQEKINLKGLLEQFESVITNSVGGTSITQDLAALTLSTMIVRISTKDGLTKRRVKAPTAFAGGENTVGGSGKEDSNTVGVVRIPLLRYRLSTQHSIYLRSCQRCMTRVYQLLATHTPLTPIIAKETLSSLFGHTILYPEPPSSLLLQLTSCLSTAGNIPKVRFAKFLCFLTKELLNNIVSKMHRLQSEIKMKQSENSQISFELPLEFVTKGGIPHLALEKNTEKGISSAMFSSLSCTWSSPKSWDKLSVVLGDLEQVIAYCAGQFEALVHEVSDKQSMLHHLKELDSRLSTSLKSLSWSWRSSFRELLQTYEKTFAVDQDRRLECGSISNYARDVLKVIHECTMIPLVSLLCEKAGLSDEEQFYWKMTEDDLNDFSLLQENRLPSSNNTLLLTNEGQKSRSHIIPTIDISSILAGIDSGNNLLIAKPMLYADVVKKAKLQHQQLQKQKQQSTPGKRKIVSGENDVMDAIGTDRRKVARTDSQAQSFIKSNDVKDKKNVKPTSKNSEMKDLLAKIQKEKTSSSRMMSFLQQQVFK